MRAAEFVYRAMALLPILEPIETCTNGITIKTIQISFYVNTVIGSYTTRQISKQVPLFICPQEGLRFFDDLNSNSLEDLVDDRSTEEDEDEEEQDDDTAYTEEEEEEAKSKQSKQSKSLAKGKPEGVQRQMEQSGRNRPPTESHKPRAPPVKYNEVTRPSTKYMERGQQPSRAAEVAVAGALVPSEGREAFMKALGKIQASRTDFLEWQAGQTDYVIYQNRGWDEENKVDVWEPNIYNVHYLTTGQQRRLTHLENQIRLLRRIANRQDQTTVPEDIDMQIEAADDELLKLKLSLYFRMYIGEVDPETNVTNDPNDEFEGSSWPDVRDMIEAAEWYFQGVPKSQRDRRSESFGSKGAKGYAGIK